MSFFSTRGGACVTASQAILYGLAPDGGLYVPSMFPRISREKLAALAGMSYCERASEILRRYLEDFSISEIDDALTAAYGAPMYWSCFTARRWLSRIWRFNCCRT